MGLERVKEHEFYSWASERKTLREKCFACPHGIVFLGKPGCILKAHEKRHDSLKREQKKGCPLYWGTFESSALRTINGKWWFTRKREFNLKTSLNLNITGTLPSGTRVEVNHKSWRQFCTVREEKLRTLKKCGLCSQSYMIKRETCFKMFILLFVIPKSNSA